jgi:hypothetical protein
MRKIAHLLPRPSVVVGAVEVILHPLGKVLDTTADFFDVHHASPSLRQSYMRFFLAASLAVFLCSPAYGHDRQGNANWISRGSFLSPVDGSHCCGVNDCVEVDPDDVHERAGGYDLRGMVTYGTGKGAKHQWIDEYVPPREVQASRDGRYYRCNYMSGPKKDQRRCFFAPPPSG